MPLLADARKKAKEMKIEGTLQLATDGKKKLVLIRPSGPKVSFGDANSKTFLQGATLQKKAAYLARHNKIKLKDGRKAVSVKYSPAWLSKKILWS